MEAMDGKLAAVSVKALRSGAAHDIVALSRAVVAICELINTQNEQYLILQEKVSASEGAETWANTPIPLEGPPVPVDEPPKKTDEEEAPEESPEDGDASGPDRDLGRPDNIQVPEAMSDQLAAEEEEDPLLREAEQHLLRRLDSLRTGQMDLIRQVLARNTP